VREGRERSRLLQAGLAEDEQRRIRAPGLSVYRYGVKEEDMTWLASTNHTNRSSRTFLPGPPLALVLGALAALCVALVAPPPAQASGAKITKPAASPRPWVKIYKNRISAHSGDLGASGKFLKANIEAQLWCDDAIATRRWTLGRLDISAHHDDVAYGWDFNTRDGSGSTADQGRKVNVKTGVRKIASDAELAAACYAARPPNPRITSWETTFEAEINWSVHCQRDVLIGDRGDFNTGTMKLPVTLKCEKIIAPTQTLARVSAQQWEFSCPEGFVIEGTQVDKKIYTENIAKNYLKDPGFVLANAEQIRARKGDAEAEAYLKKWETQNPRILKCVRPWQSSGKAPSGSRACPYYYLRAAGSGELVRAGEIIRDLVGPEMEALQAEALPALQPVDGKIEIRLGEEKDEISYLDFVALRVDGTVITAQPDSEAAVRLSASDGDYLEMRRGDTVTLVFDLSDLPVPARVEILSRGFYEPLP
jgi:hypothetical protein